MPQDLHKWSKFSSWADFEKAVAEYCRETYQPLVKSSSKKVSTYNQQAKRPLPEELEYYSKSFRCSHRGEPRREGRKIRKTRSCKEGCTARIIGTLDKNERSIIVVSVMDEKHNHEIGEHLFARYVQNRCLKGDERLYAAKLCSLNVPNKDLRREMENLTGKKVTMQDINNVKKAEKRKLKAAVSSVPLNTVQLLKKKLEARRRVDPDLVMDIEVNDSGELQPSQMHSKVGKAAGIDEIFPEMIVHQAVEANKVLLKPKAPVSSVPLNTVQLLKERLEARRRVDPGLVTDIEVNDSGELQYLFVQTSQMHSMFANFPEHVLIDATYSLNDKSMPLVSFLIVDGLNRSHIVAYAILSNETSSMYDKIFSILKNSNPASALVQNFMVHKDFTAISSLSTHFPHAYSDLRLFTKMVSQCPKNVRKEMMECLESMCGAVNEGVYESLKERLLSYDASFGAYFVKNWDCIRGKWVAYARSARVNLGDTTNNRIESFHQKLKLAIDGPLSLDMWFEKVMGFYDSQCSEFCQDEFVMLTRRCVSVFPYLQKDITPYALKCVEEECKESNVKEWSVARGSNSGTFVVTKGVEVYVITSLMCSCPFFVSMLNLPCRHIHAVQSFCNVLPLLSKHMFHPRWHLTYNCLSSTSKRAEGGVADSSMSVWDSGTLSKRARCSIVKPKLDKLMKKLSEVGTDCFTFYVNKLDEFDAHVSNLKSFSFAVTDRFDGVPVVEDVTPDPDDDVVVGFEVPP